MPPRVSLADAGEVASAPRASIEPESVKTKAAPPRPQSQAPRPPLPSMPPPLPTADPAQVLAQLQRQRDSGAPAPPPPPSKPSSITSPSSALGLKVASAPLAPSRAPSPIAIVGGSSLKLSSPDKPITPSRPPPSTLLAAIDANAPMASTNAPKPPATADSFVPPPVPMTYPPAPSTVKGLPSAPPAAPSSRPNTAPKSFAPAGGPPVQYERAFRQWSSPNITTADESTSANAGPVSFQVYTAQDISAGRAPMRSLPAIPPEAKKMSLGARIGIAAVGGVITLLTAAAVLAVSTDDPKHPAPSATIAPLPTTTTTTPAMARVPTPAPSTISIGDPIDPVDELPPVPAPSNPPPVVTAAPKPKPKPSAAATGATPAPPASLKSMAPPPNPYGK